MGDRLQGFPPVIDNGVHTMVIGSFPGVESLRTETYYGNERNHFWDIVYRSLDPAWPPYEPVRGIARQDKYAFVLKHGIGIWDIVETCERAGGQDANIKNSTFNKFWPALEQYIGIKRLFLNGQKVGFFLKQSGQMIPKHIEMVTLNSTSTLNPNNTFHILEEWRHAFTYRA